MMRIVALRPITAISWKTRYRYNAEYTDSSTGNQYLRARYYDAASGRFLTKDTYIGYTKNADGEIEIVPEEAEIIREIYERYLSGESLHGIKCYLEAKEIPTPAGCSVWRQETIRSIFSNEKYKGDAIADGIDEERITELMNEKQRLTVQLEQYATMRQKRESAKSRLDEIFTILDGLQNHPMEYDDTLVRQIIECVVVESKEKIKVVFIGGTEIEMTL